MFNYCCRLPCAGNWMWLSASAYFYQFFRVYSPVAFPKVRHCRVCLLPVPVPGSRHLLYDGAESALAFVHRGCCGALVRSGNDKGLLRLCASELQFNVATAPCRRLTQTVTSSASTFHSSKTSLPSSYTSLGRRHWPSNRYVLLTLRTDGQVGDSVQCTMRFGGAA